MIDHNILNGREKIFVDTSAFYALLDRADPNHKEASSLWERLINEDFTLVTTNYVVADTMQLLQNRLGYEAAKVWHREILSIFELLWIDKNTYQKAYELWLTLGNFPVSFVDCTSFVTMHHHHVEKVFCFQENFKTHGFQLLCVKDH